MSEELKVSIEELLEQKRKLEKIKERNRKSAMQSYTKCKQEDGKYQAYLERRRNYGKSYRAKKKAEKQAPTAAATPQNVEQKH